MGEQFHDWEVEIVRGREDICYLLGRGKSSIWQGVHGFKHSQRMMRPVSSPSAVALVRRSSSLSQFSSPDPCTSISTRVTGAQRCLKSSDRIVGCAIERGSEDDRKLCRGDRRDCPALQAERNRDGEHGDTSLRSLGFKPYDVGQSINGNFY